MKKYNSFKFGKTALALSVISMLALPSCKKDDDDMGDNNTGGGGNPSALQTDFVYTSSGSSSTVNRFEFDNGLKSTGTLTTSTLDADGLYFDATANTLFQVNRSSNRIDAFTNVNSKMDSSSTGITISISASFSSTSDFSSGREMAVSGNFMVAADNSTGNNRLVIYEKTSSNQITRRNTIDVDFKLWGIVFGSNGRLFAVKDFTDSVAYFDNFLSNTGDVMVAATGEFKVEGIYRTHGIDYNATDNVMVLTDIGEANGTGSEADGAIVVISNFSSKFNSATNNGTTNGMISSSDQIRISGTNSMLGNPVDVAYESDRNVIYVAERANGSGQLLSFNMPSSNGDASPRTATSVTAISAVYLQNR